MHSIAHPIRLVAMAIVCLQLAGCQSDSERVYPVSGRITFSDDAPVMFGTVEFRSETENPVIARGRIDKDGTFSVKSFGNRDGLVAGWHRMIILQVTGSPRDGGSVIHHHGQEVATRYSSYNSSDLRIQVHPDGPNQFYLQVDARQDQPGVPTMKWNRKCFALFCCWLSQTSS